LEFNLGIVNLIGALIIAGGVVLMVVVGRNRRV
jgi:hypothetical protein